MPRSSPNASVTDVWNASKVNKINDDLDNLFANGSDRGRVRLALSETPLAVDISPFTYFVGSAQGLHLGVTDLLVTDDAINYIEINSAGTISVNTTGWDGEKAHLAIVTAADGEITEIEVLRPDIIGGDLSGGSQVNIVNIVYDEYDRVIEAEINGVLHSFTYENPVLGFDLVSVTNPSGTQTVVRDNLGRVQSIITT